MNYNGTYSNLSSSALNYFKCVSVQGDYIVSQVSQYQTVLCYGEGVSSGSTLRVDGSCVVYDSRGYHDNTYYPTITYVSGSLTAPAASVCYTNVLEGHAELPASQRTSECTYIAVGICCLLGFLISLNLVERVLQNGRRRRKRE